ncbi:peroxiredoxin [Paenibacillus thermoaerophilus]|jgi:peroxiredoxin Q/BCP|uniref:thioredoxin-dependent peroxiredoxin n=1 Tax=Paenibacillus thermoaerophilus TaxID=1215385 RepID=A0ABW2V8C3_9BACL|nr:peroxiredoxin [Paenibacillus thermoaerophilus]TMV17855.1 peroxiredoxin [Paenibacillus thermoaerophilus]
MLRIGQAAPVFTADSTQGSIRLEEHIGKRPIVLIFYPKDNTPGCTAQLCAVRDSRRQYAEYDALVLGVNAGSLESHRQFAEKHGYDFPIVHDEGGRIRDLYDVGKILGLFLQQRVVYAIGRTGRIIFAQKGHPPTADILEALKYDREGRRMPLEAEPTEEIEE